MTSAPTSPQAQKPPSEKKSILMVMGAFVAMLALVALFRWTDQSVARDSVPQIVRIVEVSQAKIRAHYKGDYSTLTTAKLKALAFKPSAYGDAPGDAIVVQGLLMTLVAAPADQGRRFALVFRGLSETECETLSQSLIAKGLDVEVDGVQVTASAPVRCRDRRGVLRAISD